MRDSKSKVLFAGESSRNLGSNFLTLSKQTPICCPSRTETLSGRMYHNVLSDDLSGCMHVNSTGYIFQHSASLFPALRSAGYMTGGFGKIINGQGRTFAPHDDPSKVHKIYLLHWSTRLHICFKIKVAS